jgi:CRP/FNR family cyclic AMP-dependent transcriptional regulator
MTPVAEMGAGYRLLTGLDRSHVRKLMLLATEMRFEEGHIIFKQGDQLEYLYLLASGSVALEIAAVTPAIRAETIEPGDAMGWAALSMRDRTRFQARALSPVTAIAIRGSEIRALCGSDTRLGHALIKRMLELATERLNASRSQIAALIP